ncbi:ABC-F family ATP-binding cassette domain-containing protein [Roseovarius sp. EL26]|uniref:ABC-F family ATP-binding cassette domain-containing protein n=1 Tax=Roseovarius sp. EL26 TaxID=2126672 RepID=UPI000EA12387|nr:ABC-F family ATP-binding cassette domain-containing protein [Roseovarius sp. EL26]
MPATITLSSLSWSTPDGTPLFDNLNLTIGSKRTGIVGRNGTGKTSLLRLMAGEIRPHSGTVQATGCLGLIRQNILPHPGDTVVDLFNARTALALLASAEAGSTSAEDLIDVDWTLPSRIDAALRKCALSVDPQTPLAALSGGQSTRASLVALIFDQPDFLLLDEPTNNLDHDGRKAVMELVHGWRGGAVIVSHDRELLDQMDNILELTTLGATLYGGNYSAYRALKAEELQVTEQHLSHAAKNLTEVKRRARQAAERKARTNSAGQKARANKDQPKMVMNAAKERAEASGGAGARLREARLKSAIDQHSHARNNIEILQPLHMETPTTQLAKGKVVLQLDHVTGGHNPELPTIRDLSLALTGPERIAITGGNGSGKTTLIKLITGALKPTSGQIDVRASFALLDQNVDLLDPQLSLRENFLLLNPKSCENHCRAALARFLFRAEDALQITESLSGGQRLRAGLACVLARADPPQLLILDEPTNHLDLDAIKALEAALLSYDGALIVVSHDKTFLKNLNLDRKIKLK